MKRAGSAWTLSVPAIVSIVGEVGGSVRIVGRLRLGVPLAELGEQRFLRLRADEADEIGAIAIR